MNGRFHVSTDERRSLELRSAILVYGEQDDVYATVHPVNAGESPPSLGPGIPASREAVAALARAFAEKTAASGYVPQSVVWFGMDLVAWWLPPATRTHYFSCRQEKKKVLGERTGLAPAPGLVFALARGRWFVYAVKGADRPEARTRLHNAPYFNVWANGEICTGDATMPHSAQLDALAAIEDAFFRSRFTHPNMPPKRLVKWKASAYAFWRHLLDRRPAAFPEAALVERKETLADLPQLVDKERHR